MMREHDKLDHPDLPAKDSPREQMKPPPNRIRRLIDKIPFPGKTPQKDRWDRKFSYRKEGPLSDIPEVADE